MKTESVISLLTYNNLLLEKCFIEMAIANPQQASAYCEVARNYRDNKALLENLEIKSDTFRDEETQKCFEKFVSEMTAKILRQDPTSKEIQRPVEITQSKYDMVIPERKRPVIEFQSALKTQDYRVVATHGQKKGYTKNARTNLTVDFENGPRIHRSVARDTFVEALEFMGLEKARAIGIKVCGEPLISETQSKNSRYAAQQPRSGNYYIFTYTSTQKKKSYIEEIASRLGLNVKVEIS